jgi:hypothetical protein
LWERRQGRRLTLADYQALGRLEGALEQRANAIYKAFTDEEKEQCRRIFLRLTQPGEGTEDTKRRVAFHELLPIGGDAKLVEQVVRKLADERLVIMKGEKGAEAEAQVEVAHEALIKGWTELRQWLAADREGLLTHRRLREAAEEWDKNKRDDSYLHRGLLLERSQTWAGKHPSELNPLEKAFLAKSQADEKKHTDIVKRVLKFMAETERAWRFFIVGIIAMAVFLVVLHNPPKWLKPYLEKYLLPWAQQVDEKDLYPNLKPTPWLRDGPKKLDDPLWKNFEDRITPDAPPPKPVPQPGDLEKKMKELGQQK